MGCGSSALTKIRTINVKPTAASSAADSKIKLRMRLRGDIPSVTAEMIHKSLIDFLGGIPAIRVVVEESEKGDVYFATIKPDVGDEPGQVGKYARRIIGAASGKGLMIGEDVAKIIGAKEYMQIDDLED